MRHLVKSLAILAATAAAVLPLIAGCTPPEETQSEDLELTPDEETVAPLSWEQLMGSLESATRDTAALPSAAATTGAGAVVVPAERLAQLPLDLQREPRLAQLALARKLEQPQAYENGVFGLVGTAKVFASTTDNIETDERLYWVLVKVLSEKYGCFMIGKQNVGNTVRVTCRDKRRVVFWKARGKDWVQLHSRQYDTEGYEIVVRQRRIVRVGTKRML